MLYEEYEDLRDVPGAKVCYTESGREYIVMPDGLINLGDRHCFFSTECCVKTEEEKQEILDDVKNFWSEFYLRKHFKENGLDFDDYYYYVGSRTTKKKE